MQNHQLNFQSPEEKEIQFSKLLSSDASSLVYSVDESQQNPQLKKKLMNKESQNVENEGLRLELEKQNRQKYQNQPYQGNMQSQEIIQDLFQQSEIPARSTNLDNASQNSLKISSFYERLEKEQELRMKIQRMEEKNKQMQTPNKEKSNQKQIPQYQYADHKHYAENSPLVSNQKYKDSQKLQYTFQNSNQKEVLSQYENTEEQPYDFQQNNQIQPPQSKFYQCQKINFQEENSTDLSQQVQNEPQGVKQQYIYEKQLQQKLTQDLKYNQENLNNYHNVVLKCQGEIKNLSSTVNYSHQLIQQLSDALKNQEKENQIMREKMNEFQQMNANKQNQRTIEQQNYTKKENTLPNAQHNQNNQQFGNNEMQLDERFKTPIQNNTLNQFPQYQEYSAHQLQQVPNGPTQRCMHNVNQNIYPSHSVPLCTCISNLNSNPFCQNCFLQQQGFCQIHQHQFQPFQRFNQFQPQHLTFQTPSTTIQSANSRQSQQQNQEIQTDQTYQEQVNLIEQLQANVALFEKLKKALAKQESQYKKKQDEVQAKNILIQKLSVSFIIQADQNKLKKILLESYQVENNQHKKRLKSKEDKDLRNKNKKQ